MATRLVGTRLAQFSAIMLTALALVPAGAHGLELVNKIGLDRDHYMAAQQLYRGWALLGVLPIAAVIANVLAAIAMRPQWRPVSLAASASLLVLAGLAIFFAWTFPANQATSNWTTAPAAWAALRLQWEYSHAANALATLLALAMTTAASLSWSR
jgi:hypothetical protein